MDVQPTNLQQLCDAIMSIWTKISEECFQHLVESMPQIIKAVLKEKGVQPGTSQVYLIKWPVSVYMAMFCPETLKFVYCAIFVSCFQNKHTLHHNLHNHPLSDHSTGNSKSSALADWGTRAMLLHPVSIVFKCHITLTVENKTSSF